LRYFTQRRGKKLARKRLTTNPSSGGREERGKKEQARELGGKGQDVSACLT